MLLKRKTIRKEFSHLIKSLCIKSFMQDVKAQKQAYLKIRKVGKDCFHYRGTDVALRYQKDLMQGK